MKSIKAVYDGKRVKLLEPVDLPADTPLEIIVKKKSPGKKRSQDPWDSLGDDAIDLGMDDLAEQHDHYLYGIPKRRRHS
ncbi:MAG: antitoxin AF2212-like protein [Candidatus Binatia bacterium]